MKYAFHIVDVFSSTPFGGNQLAVRLEAVGARRKWTRSSPCAKVENNFLR
jgi:predicted PhzF superfamily epimerase YddE/YHI9